MAFKEKKSFLERFANLINNNDEDALAPAGDISEDTEKESVDEKETEENWIKEENNEGELTIDVYQKPSEIILQSMVAGVKPDDLDVAITREMITIKGKRERPRGVSDDTYLHQELYWGAFSRSVMLPEEIDVDASEAGVINGLLTIRLPKIDKKRSQKLKIQAA